MTQEELNSIISELDQLLHIGFLRKRNSWSEYEKESKKENFDVKKFKSDYEEEINNWYRTIADLLFTKSDVKYLYFHFVEPKKEPALSFTHPLGQLNHAVEAYLFALEDIILRLEELLMMSMTGSISRSVNKWQVLIPAWACYRKQKTTTT